MSKDDFKTKMEESINEWGKELAGLMSRSDSVPDHKKEGHQQEVEALEKKIEDAKVKVTEVDNSPDSQWENLKEGFSKAWDSLVKK